SADIGTGHVMRCLALAQAWQTEGGKVTFLVGMIAPELDERLQSEGFAVLHHEKTLGSREDGDHTIAWAQELEANAVVVDGYHFGSAYQKRLKQAGLQVLFIDDNGHANHYYADWVLNQNIYAHEGLYTNKEPYTQLLLGTRYALLRKEFWPWRDWQREIAPHPDRILVTLGGSDPNNVTLRIIQALQKIETRTLEVSALVGASNPHYEMLQGAVKTDKHHIELRRNVNNMPELMAWADIAISAGGSTNWELAFMGLPSLVIPLAENQIEIVRTLASMELVVSLEKADIFVPERLDISLEQLKDCTIRNDLMQRGQKLVDGQGTNKVASFLIGGER
ncbi:MAG: UDP-2,4-diacetamido-2,4,6-trideoxy-beta-L-altropyranose hydrolase, partial [Cyanobacteria bacterium P01_A01_bin.17]